MRRKTVMAFLAVFLLGLAGCSGKGTAPEVTEQSQTDKTEVESQVQEIDEYTDIDTSFNTYMEARFTEDGTTGYIPIGNGECIQIQEEEGITFAAISPNRRHIVVLLNNDELYVTDIKQKDKNVISTSCASSRIYPSDEGMGFQEYGADGEKHLVRYTFADDALVDLGACSVGKISGNGTAAAGISEGVLCLLTSDSGEILRYPGVGNDEINLKDLPDDGSTVIWTEETDQFLQEKLYTLGTDGSPRLLGDITARGMISSSFSKDSKFALVTSEQVNHLYLKDADGQWKRVELPGDLKNETGVYETDAGLLNQVNADEIHYLYLRCGNQLCAVSPDGSVTTVKDSVQDFDILNGMLYYSDSQKNIYSAELNGSQATGDKLLISGMDTFTVSSDGQYLYGMYVHHDDEKVRSLSVYPLKEENASEIILSEAIYADSHVYLSAEDNDVYYIEDIQKAGDSSNYIGTLKVFHVRSGETEIIDEDVYKNTFVNGKEYVLVSEYAQSMAGAGKFVLFHENLMYKKKPEANTDGYRFDWYYYDGVESICMASDLDY